MAETQSRPRLVRFGAFEADVQTGELRKDGVKLKFSGQPFQVLAILLERPGDVVTREELQKRLWPDTFVDVERNLNTAVNKIREVLGDSAESPRFVETLPRRGYRFIAPVERLGGAAGYREDPVAVPRPARIKTAVVLFLVSSTFVLLAGAGWLAYQKWRTHVPAGDGVSPGSPSTKACRPDPPGRPMAASSPTVPTAAESSISGSSKSAAATPSKSPNGRARTSQPAWSPEGKYIAYRSEQGDGGIYVIPALGGAGLERKIAPFGYFPQWSPDSSQVLFRTHFTAIGYSNRFYVARLDGSPPREVLGEWISQKQFWATSAAWHPDGKRITVWVGTSSPTPAFWTVPLDGEPGIELDIPPAVQKELTEASGDTNVSQQFGEYRFCWSPSGNVHLFRAGLQRREKHLEADSRSRNAASYRCRSPDHWPGARCRTRGFCRWQAAGLHGEVAANSNLALPVRRENWPDHR